MSQPTDILPPELLSSVFLWGLPDSRYEFGVDKYRRTISRVCRSWRALCLGTPLLWRAVHVRAGQGFLSPHTRDRLIAESLIRRAGTVPLDLDIDLYYGIPMGVDPVLRRLKAEIPRLRTLRFRSRRIEHFVEFFPLAPSMPFLKGLEIDADFSPWDHLTSINLWEYNSSFPALKTISINGGIPPDAFQCIPCHQISHLQIDMDGLKTLGDEERIACFTRLQSLKFDLYDFEGEEGPEADETLKYLPQLPRNSLHSMQFRWCANMLPRSLGDTSSIRHLGLETTWENDIPVFGKTYFPRLRTFSPPLGSPADPCALCEFIRARPSIFAIELGEYQYHPVFWLLFSEQCRNEAYNVRFIRIAGLDVNINPDDSGSDSSRREDFEDDLQNALTSRWAPRIEWMYPNPRWGSSGQGRPDYHSHVKAVAERFPGQFRWIDAHEAIPLNEISSLGTDGWPVRE